VFGVLGGGSRQGDGLHGGIGKDLVVASRRNGEVAPESRSRGGIGIRYGRERPEFREIPNNILSPVAATDNRDSGKTRTDLAWIRHMEDCSQS
jgi:hypothetical protein